MRIKFDKEADALYFRLDEKKIVGSEEISLGIVLDYDDSDQVVGVEFLNVSTRANQEELSTVLFQTV